MLILTIRTDKPEAEIGLFDSTFKLGYKVWYAHRQLSTTLHKQIYELLRAHGKQWQDIQGIVCFQGPGSFTGLRIGLTVANALAFALRIPVVALQDADWVERGVARLRKGEDDHMALPHYGAEAHITLPKR